MNNTTGKIKRSEPILRSAVFALFRRKLMAAAIFLGVCTPLALTALRTPPTYQSEVKFLVKPGREAVADVALMYPTQVGVTREQMLNTELEILRSRDVARRVVQKLGKQVVLDPVGYGQAHGDPIVEEPKPDDKLAAENASGWAAWKGRIMNWIDPPPDDSAMEGTVEDAIDGLSAGLDVFVLEETNVVMATYQSPSPSASRDVLRTLRDVYMEAHMQAYSPGGQVEDFFESRRESWERALSRTNDRLEAIRREYQVASLPAQLESLEEQLAAVRTETRQERAELLAAEERIALYEQEIARLPQMVEQRLVTGRIGEAVQALQRELVTLQSKLAQLQHRYAADTPPVLRTIQDIAALEKLLAAQDPEQQGEHTKELNPIRQRAVEWLLETRGNYRAAQKRLQVLESQQVHLLNDIERLNGVEAEFRRLEKAREVQEGYQRTYQEKLEQVRIDREQEKRRISNINVLQQPTFPRDNIAASKKTLILAGLVMGLLCGVGYALLLHFIDRTIQTPHRVERELDVANLASVPLMRSKAVAPRRHKGEIRSSEQARSIFDPLCVRLLAPAEQDDPLFKTIAIVGCEPRDGTTSVAANLALSFARISTGEVLLIDADFQAPQLHEIFGIDKGPGLAELVEQEEEVDLDDLVHQPVTNLSIMPIGTHPAALDDEEGLRRLAARLPAIRYRYRYVLIDVPPAAQWASSVRVARMADAALLVVKAGAVRADDAAGCMEMLQGAGANVLGAVLNAQRQPIPSWIDRRL